MLDSCRCNSQHNKKHSKKKNAKKQSLKSKAAAYVLGKDEAQFRQSTYNKIKTHQTFNVYEPDSYGIQTPFLKYAELAKALGAWQSVKSNCPFCTCCRSCCGCRRVKDEYNPGLQDEAKIMKELQDFDQRVSLNTTPMKIMYDVD